MHTPPPGTRSSPPPGPRRRTGGRSARIQAAVFEATLQLLQEKGYEAWSFAVLSERAGVHETTLYRHWQTKEHLVFDVVASQVAHDIPIPDTGALRADLIQLLHSLRVFLQSPLGQVLIQAGVEARHVPMLGTLTKEYWRRRSRLLRPLFERAMVRGELSSQTDIPLLFELLIGVFYVRLFVLGEALEETLPERVVDVVFSGVGTGPSRR